MARVMILVSKNIYSSRGIQCCILRILISRIHTSMRNLYLESSKIGSIKARDMIFVPENISTRARKFNGIFRKILKSCNHALHIRIFIDAPLNSLSRVDILLSTQIMFLDFIDPILDILGKNST